MDTIEKIKITILFWWKVLGEILRSVISGGSFVNNVPAIVAALLVSILSGVGISKTDIAKVAWTEITGQQPGAWLAVVSALLVYIVINLLYQPANMYKKLGGFVNQPFKLTPRPRVDDNRPQSQPRSGSITVENVLAKKTLKDCVLTIDSIKDKDGKERLYSQQRRVSWSSGLRSDPTENKRINQEIDIRPKIPVVADLFETQNNNTIVPTTWSPHPALPIGVYDVRVMAHGRLDGFDVNEEKTFVVEYIGGNNIVVIEKTVKNKKSK